MNNEITRHPVKVAAWWMRRPVLLSVCLLATAGSLGSASFLAGGASSRSVYGLYACVTGFEAGVTYQSETTID